MALAIYVTIDGTADEIAIAAAQVQSLRTRSATDTRPPKEWLAAVLTDVVEEYLRNAAAVAARQAMPPVVRLAAPPPSGDGGPTWADVSRVELPTAKIRPVSVPVG